MSAVLAGGSGERHSSPQEVKASVRFSKSSLHIKFLIFAQFFSFSNFFNVGTKI